VGERVVNLSGGQRQRISIARALLKDPTILILDDSTSALDTETELMIHRQLKSVAKSRTVIIIAHRISTVKQADRIVVLNEGRVEEMGTHDELADAGGIYSEIYNIQLSGQESDGV
jgi:ABC-type multidrug transport system fused ATPase/permease subunit